MADEAYWQYEVDSAQRSGATEAWKERHNVKGHRSDPTDGNAPNNEHNEDDGSDGFDRHGIPTGDI